jgi:hypothetical protein
VVQHILEDIQANANDFDQQERVVKVSLRAQSSLLVYCLTKAPSTTMAAGVPALAKLHAIKHATSKVVAVELLKKTGLDSSNSVVALAAALSPSILTGFLDGSRLNVANLLIRYNAYKQVRVPGCRPYSLTEILSNLTFFRSFILVVIKLLAALGLHAENLMTMVDLATSIEEALPPSSLLRVLSTVIPPSLRESLEHFSSSIKAWIVSFSSVPVDHLVLEASRVHAALKAINKDRKRDLSQFGLPSSSLFASVSSAAPRQDSSSSLKPFTSALKRNAQVHLPLAFPVPGRQVSLTQLTNWLLALPYKSPPVLLQVHSRLHFLTLQIVQAAESLNGVETTFWLHPCSRSFENNILSIQSCQTMKFYQFSLLQEMVKPTSFDTFLRTRLNQRNVPFGIGLTKTNTRNTGSKSRRIFVRRRGIELPRRLQKSQTFSTFETSRKRYSARPVSTRYPCSSIGLDFTFNGCLVADSTGLRLRHPRFSSGATYDT